MGHFEINTSDIKLCLGAAEVSAAYLGTEKVYPIETSETSNYLSFTNIGNLDAQLSFDNISNIEPRHDFEYSYDGNTWTSWTNYLTTSLTIQPNEKIYLRGNNNTINSLRANGGIDRIEFNFTHTQGDSNQGIEAHGNIMSLLSKTNFENLTTVPDYCFYYLFSGSTSLKTAPELPATTVGAECYCNMFFSTSITTAPELPATTLANGCYQGMFMSCLKLTTAPSILPATTLANSCYEGMFETTKITTAPELPATTLADSCYKGMFRYCTLLTTAPELPATTLVTDCYKNMFKGCTSLNYIKALFTTTPSTSYTSAWVEDVAATGTFVKDAAATWTDTGIDAVPVGWTIQKNGAQSIPNYLSFTYRGDGDMTVMFATPQTDINWANHINLEYSYDGETWTDWNGNFLVKESSPVISTNETLYLRGNNTSIAIPNTNGTVSAWIHFAPQIDSEVQNPNTATEVHGNIMSLLSKTGFEELTSVPECCFAYLFQNNTEIITAPELPATTVGQYAYSNMFNGCTALTTAPALPATTLNTECYSYMFTGCTSLTAPPTTLPATTLADACYRSMFKNCVIMTLTPTLPALTMTQDCYREMFYGCDYMTTAPALPATTVATRCYYSMFEHCDTLETPPPVLPATTLASSCYANMFKQCGRMTTAPIIQATTCAQSCCYRMFYYCSWLSQVPALPATTLANNCYYQMFYKCNGLTQAPVLPALTLVTDCYKNMFYSCKNLSYVKAMFTTTPGYSYTTSWLYGVASGGTFVKNAAATWTEVSYNAVPSGWTIETASS